MRKILIVDDDPDIVEILRLSFPEDRYKVIEAYDGIKAVKKVYEEKPDAIILDILLPEMNGYQVARLLKNQKEYKDIPIVILSAKTQKVDKFWAFQAGADHYITKPFDPNEVVNTIKKLLRKR
jgi:DNA-binding response OmpR family regulator